MVVRGHHFSFTVRDLDRSKAFYGGVLGLEEVERPNFPFPGAWFSSGETQVHLIEVQDAEGSGRDRPTPIANHSAFQVADYDSAVETLKSHGLPVKEFGKEVGQMFTQDPDGNVIELIVPGGRLGRTDSLREERA